MSDKGISLPCTEEGSFQRGDLFFACKKTREGRHAILALAAGQVTLIQSNQYAIVGYLQAACLYPDKSMQDLKR